MQARTRQQLRNVAVEGFEMISTNCYMTYTSEIFTFNKLMSYGSYISIN